MKFLSMNIRKLVFIGVLVSLFILFSYVVLKSGPLAPVLVTSATVKSRSITPALFGIGTVEARYTHKIGPTIAGRIKQVYVHAGDNVHAGQLLGEMDFVDLNERISAQKSLIKKGAAAFLVAKAQVLHASASNTYAKKQANRYEQLWEKRTVSKDQLEVKQQERQTAKAVLDAAYANLDVLRHDLAKLRANLRGLILHQSNLRLVSPINGLVVARDADPGTTMIAGQSVVNIVDPKNLWINVRFNQTSSYGISKGLPAAIVLRSQAKHVIAGKVVRVEPLADAVTEESLAKVVFNVIPKPLPFIGELAEVTVSLPPLSLSPIVFNASLHRINNHLGVWLIKNGGLHFVNVKVGLSDLDGRVQILEGLKDGDRIVVYSQSALNSHSRIKVVKNLPGTSP